MQLPYGVGFADYYSGRGGASYIVDENQKRGVVVQAWSPLGRALRGRSREVCDEIGTKYGKSAAQVALKWIAATGCTFTTQSKSKSHFKENRTRSPTDGPAYTRCHRHSTPPGPCPSRGPASPHSLTRRLAPAHMACSCAVELFDFELTAKEVALLSSL